MFMYDRAHYRVTQIAFIIKGLMKSHKAFDKLLAKKIFIGYDMKILIGVPKIVLLSLLSLIL